MNTLIAEELRIGNFTLDCNLIVNYFTKKKKKTYMFNKPYLNSLYCRDERRRSNSSFLMCGFTLLLQDN